MSTILDALKRSEQERKINKTPTLSDMPTPEERSRWPLLLVAVLVLLLVAALLWYFLLGAKLLQTQTQPMSTNQETASEALESDQAANSDTINVSVISYAQEPSARFVIVNDKLFREGQFVMAGVKVESILADSVVLIERGKRITYQP